MKKITLLVLSICIGYCSFAQTKKVEHRSHAGSNNTFTTKGNSNFGLPPNYKEERRRMDSLRKAKELQDSIAKKKQADSLAKPKVKRKKKG